MRFGGSALALAALLAVGCRSSAPVARVYDGRIVPGRYVPPDAYAWFLRGVIAEENADLAGAAHAYEEALAAGEADPLVLARLGAVRCRQNPKGQGLPVELHQALALDSTYALAHTEASRCAASRGDLREASASADEALAEDPFNVTTSARRVRADGDGGLDARARATATTLLFAERAPAWDALRAWGDAHRDPVLVARGLIGLLRTAPQRSSEVGDGASALAVAGHVTLATDVAVALADAPAESGVLLAQRPVIARLAVDEALMRRDEAAARRRATRARVGLGELAGRAAFLGAEEIARRIAGELVAADPGASAARMVLAALGDDTALAGGRVTDVPPQIAVHLLARRLHARSGAKAAQAFVRSAGFAAAPPGDPVARDLERALVEREVLPPPAGYDRN